MDTSERQARPAKRRDYDGVRARARILEAIDHYQALGRPATKAELVIHARLASKGHLDYHLRVLRTAGTVANLGGARGYVRLCIPEPGVS